MQLLETAGFSRSNPYYVVQQGRVRRQTTPYRHRLLCAGLSEHRLQSQPADWGSPCLGSLHCTLL